MRRTWIGIASLLVLFCGTLLAAPTTESPLQGTWTLVAANRLLPTGEEVSDYGASPKGRLIVDSEGRYSLQIFKSERPKFLAADKASGTGEEFKAAVLGSSTHFGTLTVDPRGGVLTFTIESSSFPNWEGTVQERTYTLKDEVLTYRVPPRPDGSVPVSVWRRQS